MSEIIENQKMIIFQLSENEYAIPVNQVRSIEKILPITRVPNVAHFVKGVMNLRGVVTPVIDLRNRFGIKEVEYSNHSRVIIVNVEEIEVGLIVDEANDVLDIHNDNIQPSPDITKNSEVDFIGGVVNLEKRLITVIDLSKVLDRNAFLLNRLEG
ncbi:chemotaxis protein CheW [Bacillus sp. 03113]|uniref:chemotaxis protein CheW n=1 Tax=Bacillus sp. 03113 TaxID=2578211 RepID=UPI00114510EB|nr:chemotaxis protein CheW [Bacillus sp. 03113]